MDRFYRALLVLVALAFLPFLSFADEIPINILPNVKNINIPTETVMNIVKKNVDVSPAANISRVKVQVMKHLDQSDYLLVYLLSSQNYSLTITKIDLDPKFQVKTVTKNYHLTNEDLQQQPQAFINKAKLDCPDNSIKFVAATPCDYIRTAKEAIQKVGTQAGEFAYTSQKLLGKEATTTSYLSWMNCPNLKGFFNVGHGNDSGILLDDGFLSSNEISSQLQGKLGKQVTVLFNSCEVFNDPLKGAIIDDANAQKYAGGVTTLWIGPSEAASQCFWDAAFKQKDMSPALKECNEKHDPTDVFGIGGNGEDLLSPA